MSVPDGLVLGPWPDTELFAAERARVSALLEQSLDELLCNFHRSRSPEDKATLERALLLVSEPFSQMVAAALYAVDQA